VDINLMDSWLVENEGARYNLGESGVTNLRIDDLAALSGGLRELLRTDFDHNDTFGSLALREAILDLYPGATLEQCLVTTGATEALFLYFHVRFGKGANVVVVGPAFHALYDTPAAIGYEVRRIDARYEEGFRVPLDRIAAAVDEHTRAVVLTTPSNPTGYTATPAELEALVALVERSGCDLVLDEHYRLISFGVHAGLRSAFGSAPRIVSIGSIGKCLGCVGLRVGWLMGPARLIEQAHALKCLTSHAICKINDRIAVGFLEAREQLALRFTDWVQRNIACFGAFVADHAAFISWIAPTSGTVAFPRLVQRGRSSMSFAQELLTAADVLILPGESFDMPGFFRVRLGVDPDDFRVATALMSRFLRDHRGHWAAD